LSHSGQPGRGVGVGVVVGVRVDDVVDPGVVVGAFVVVVVVSVGVDDGVGPGVVVVGPVQSPLSERPDLRELPHYCSPTQNIQ